MKLLSVAPEQFVEVWPGSGRPQISALMPIYRQPRFVRDAIRSILAQKGIATEIIISDDASDDSTFDLARRTVAEWLSDHPTEHRVVMRRSKERLWRDHLPLLVDRASTDLVYQAHGDDLSHPERSLILASTFNSNPRVSMVVSEVSLIDEMGQALDEERVVPRNVVAQRIPFDPIMRGLFPPGSCQAWRRSAVSCFERLDRQLAAVAHDRILPFRAALVGDVVQVRAQLLKRRQHALSASHLMFDEPETDGRFGWSLTALTHLLAMRRDLDRAVTSGMIDAGRRRELRAKLAALASQCANTLVDVYKLQTRAGRKIAWVDEDTLLELRAARAKPD